MPVKLTKLPSGKVKVSTPSGTKAKATTMEKAKSQEKLLNAVEHGWTPTGKPAGKQPMTPVLGKPSRRKSK